MTVIANDLKKGMAVKWKDDIWVVMGTQHRTPGNLHAFVQGEFRSIKSGRSFNQRFGSSERLELVNMMRTKWEFSYKDQTGYIFINPDTYDSITLAEELVADVKMFLRETLLCDVLFIDDKAVQVEAPPSVVLKVVSSPEGVKGNSATNVQKAATLETGLVVQVPLFIKEGEMIKIDTRDSKYMGRA